MSRVKKYGKKRKRWRTVAVIVLLVAAVYLGGSYFFYTHYYPNTKVGNIDISFKSKDQAMAYVKDELEKYTITVVEPEGTEEITAKDAGLSFSDINKVEKILADQVYYFWPYEVTQKFDYNELNIQVDQNALSSYVDTMKCMSPANPVESVCASIEYKEKKKIFKIVPESIGNIVDKQHFMTGLTDALVNHDKEFSLMEDKWYVQPKYKADSKEVKEALEKMNKFLDGVVTYKDGSMKTKTYRKDIANMINCSKDFEVKISKKKAKKFVEDEVAKTFNSLEGDIPSGITAWKVSVKKETDKMMKNIQTGKRTTRKPVYEKEGFNRDTYNVGNTIIDVNLSDQRMWYVEDGKIRLSSDVVTGCIATGHGTTTGFYRIAYKQRDHLMVKYNSFVHYWMPYNTTVGVGFHDASWRYSFGGQIYRTNGSHGCINMPPSKAAELFGMVSAGTGVYIHW